MHELAIHFDVPEHGISLKTFSQAIAHTETIISSLNRDIFNDHLQYELWVLPPEKGSFKAKLGIIVLAGTIAWGFLESNIGQSFIQGLTGKTPAYWAEIAGKKIRSTILSSDTEENDNDTASKKVICVAEAILIVEVTKKFLELKEDKLTSLGVSVKKFRSAYEAKNKFYKVCMENTYIQGIGFEEEEKFPVSRQNFQSMQVSLPEKELADNIWNTEITELKVTSPNWERNDNHRWWKGKDTDNRTVHFKIEDDGFWNLVENKSINLQIIDSIRVQLAYVGEQRHRRNARALKILWFNETFLSPPLQVNQVYDILRMNKKASPPRHQLDFFSSE
ncbi:hypothetical protein CSC3H3_17330 [Thalassospira marina]|uniref:Uncharacterized protein n=2 Tax=Thalassospira marina TaxID=2048283 RepID=A0ABM6QCP2_9PROT|nr:hypothetical protein CSC3H3_17330 [Thalassospira marina]